MTLTLQWFQDPFFKPYIKHFKSGELLFHQGETGNTCFVILVGRIQLLMESEVGEYVFSVQGPGEFLGEKSFFTESHRQRIFSAQAESDVTAVELGFKEMELLQSKNGQLVIEILRKVIEGEAARLDKANYLARILRGSDNRKRFSQCVMYIAQVTGKKTQRGIEIPSLLPALDYFLGLDPQERDALMKELETQGTLKKQPAGPYLLLSPP